VVGPTHLLLFRGDIMFFFLTEEMLRRRLVPIVGEPGAAYHADNEEEEAEWEDDTEVDKVELRKAKPLNERPMNHQRCIWLNNSSFVKAYIDKMRAKRIAAAVDAQKKAVNKAKRDAREAAKKLKIAANLENLAENSVNQLDNGDGSEGLEGTI
jgi:hypothetical protein